MGQALRKRPTLLCREALHRIHKVDVCRPAFQQVHDVLPQSRIAASAALLDLGGRSSSFLQLGLLLQLDLSEIRTCCGISGTACTDVLANPALRNIFSYSR